MVLFGWMDFIVCFSFVVILLGLFVDLIIFLQRVSLGFGKGIVGEGGISKVGEFVYLVFF